MNVLICGASDLIEEIFPSFDRIVDEFGFKHDHFDDLNPQADNFNTWVQNSILAVKSSDIIVFVIKELSGEITWQHEYVQAINDGKPFVLLVSNKLWAKYLDSYKKNELKNVSKHAFYNAFLTLDKLLAEERTPLSFDGIIHFEQQLKKALLNELQKGIAILQEHNKRKYLIENIKTSNHASFLDSEINPSKIEYLKIILLDPFEHKEIRKRILTYFTVKKSLSDAEIIHLLEDSEQGVSRTTAEHLHELINADNNKKFIIDHLISIIESSDDSGIIRRSITSIFMIDIKIATKSLLSLFPAYDIGTPKRILKWLMNNLKEIKKYAKDNEFNKNIKELINLSESYSSKPESLKEMASELKKAITKIKK